MGEVGTLSFVKGVDITHRRHRGCHGEASEKEGEEFQIHAAALDSCLL